jgi:histone deacetylase 11
MRYATQGTIDAAMLAVKEDVAINLGGGYHHAEADTGGGFCVYADINIAMSTILEKCPIIKKIMYLDLDAHQGNGVESILQKRADYTTYVVDCYNENNYPRDTRAAQRIDHSITSSHIYCETHKGLGRLGHYRISSCKDCSTAYITAIQEKLPQAFETYKPDVVFYNAGTDPYEGDKLGAMHVSKQHMIERDEFVFKLARDKGCKVVMTTSGGYSSKSAEIIGESIINLRNKGLLQRYER